MKAIGFGFLLASALSVSGAIFPGTWSYLNPLPSPNTAWGLHAHNGLWVVVGEGGLIATASAAPGADTVWTTQRSGTLRFLYDVGYGNGVWVVVGGEGALLSSPDGIHWTDRSTGLGGAGLESVHFGGNEWMAVGSSGTILSSTNGVSWIPRDSGTQTALYGVHHANGLWVAVGDDGLVLTSSDGVAWLPQDSGIEGYLDDVHYGDGRWVAVGGDGTYSISPDGVSWQPAEIAVPSVVVSYLTRVHHAAGLWVVTAGNGQIFQSPDAVTWSVAGTQGTTSFFTDVHVCGRPLGSDHAGADLPQPVSRRAARVRQDAGGHGQPD